MSNYAKLRDGSWGIRGPGLVEGAQVVVTKRSGDTRVETIGEVIWRGTDGTCLARLVRRSIERAVEQTREWTGVAYDASDYS